MKKDKRRRQTRIILVIIIAVAVVACYVLPIATLGAAGTEEPPVSGGGEEEFGTDDPSIVPPENYVPPEVVEEKPPATLEIIPNYPSTMDIDEHFTFSCNLMNAPEGTYEEWSSSNPSVLIIDSAGSAVAMAPGSAEITVHAGNLRASVFVRVNDLKANKISLKIIDVIGEPNIAGRIIYNIEVSDVIQMQYAIEPKGAKVESIKWSVTDTEIAELSNTGELIALASGEIAVTVTSGALSDTAYFVIAETGVSVDTIYKYIILIVVIIVVVVVVSILIVRTMKKRKEEELRRAAEERRKKEEARKRAEEARKKAADEAEMAAQVERNKQVLDIETTAHRTAKVSGATVSASGDANKPKPGEEERPLTLDDIG